MKLVYDIADKPPIKKNLIYAFQQLLAIMAATLLVPILVDGTGVYMSQPAALCGAGFGTLFYLFIATKKKSPVFLGSSFAFISPLAGAVHATPSLMSYVGMPPSASVTCTVPVG